MQKTLAWGGVYGASTSIEESEDTFADGVATTVTGQEHAPPTYAVQMTGWRGTGLRSWTARGREAVGRKD